jgi:hypothetical protein
VTESPNKIVRILRQIQIFWAWWCRVWPRLTHEIMHLIEGLTLIGIFVCVSWAGYWIVFGPANDDHRNRMLDLVRIMSDGWKALLILLILLFYRTLRSFLDRVEEIAGVKAGTPKFVQPQTENPQPHQPT